MSVISPAFLRHRDLSEMRRGERVFMVPSLWWRACRTNTDRAAYFQGDYLISSPRPLADSLRGVRQYAKDNPLNHYIDNDNDDESHEQMLVRHPSAGSWSHSLDSRPPYYRRKKKLAATWP
jgi:hypothetical protein